MSDKTIDDYALGAAHASSNTYDCCPDQLTTKRLEVYFAKLVEFHSWSTVKIDRNGLQFFWKYVLKLDWQWVNMIKTPKVHLLPGILTVVEVKQLIGATRKLSL